MKTFMFFLFLFVSNIIANSQENFSDPLVLDSIFEPKLSGESYIAKSGMIGSQFINEDWIESDILLTNGQKIFRKLLKYNGLTDEVVWLMPETFKQVKIDKYSVDEFVFKNYFGKSVRFRRINTNRIFQGDTTDIFAEVAYESKLSLFICRKIVVVAIVNKDNNGGVYNYEELGQSPVYYLKLTNHNFVSLHKLKRRVLLNLFPEQKPAIRKLLRQNHQSLATEADLVKIVELLNKYIFI